MKFIFPQNYNFKTKMLGMIDYSTAILIVVWSIIIIFTTNILFKSLNIKIFLCVSLIFPVIIISIVGINGENIIYVSNYIIKYIFKQKVYLYNKK